MTLTFEYEGQLENADNSPVPGLNLANIGDDTSYLLYAGRWFPVNGYGINRFTSTISVNAARSHDRDWQRQDDGLDHGTAQERPRESVLPTKTYTFVSDKPSFPGTIVAGVSGIQKRRSRTRPARLLQAHASSVLRRTRRRRCRSSLTSSHFRVIASQKLNLVELPGDTCHIPGRPEIVGMAGRSITEKTNYRLLATAISHQWWGVSVSPAYKDDWWLSDGFARYSEACTWRTLPEQAGLEEAVKDMSVGALAYDTVPLSSASKLDHFFDGVSVAGHGQRRDDPAHAALGSR